MKIFKYIIFYIFIILTLGNAREFNIKNTENEVENLFCKNKYQYDEKTTLYLDDDVYMLPDKGQNEIHLISDMHFIGKGNGAIIDYHKKELSGIKFVFQDKNESLIFENIIFRNSDALKFAPVPPYNAYELIFAMTFYIPNDYNYHVKFKNCTFEDSNSLIASVFKASNEYDDYQIEFNDCIFR